MMWRGMKVLPGFHDPYGSDLIKEHYKREEADVLITLCDIWVLSADQLKDINVVHWLPVDCRPLGKPDRSVLMQSGARPMAFSEFGHEQLTQAGFEALYTPHGIDTKKFHVFPDAKRKEIREEMELSDKFVIGINVANKDPFRKGVAEQIAAFAKLYEEHDDVFLMIHGMTQEPNSTDVLGLVRDIGISKAVRFVDQYLYMTGQISVDNLVNWYNTLDLYTSCSYGEGFGLTVLEAQACGVPVVCTNASAMPQLCGNGWLVTGEPFYNPTHRAWWVKPFISEIYNAYKQAYNGLPADMTKEKIRTFALSYSLDQVEEEYWKPSLKAIEDAL